MSDALPIRAKVHHGQHMAIVPQDLWDKVQQSLNDRQGAAKTEDRKSVQRVVFYVFADAELAGRPAIFKLPSSMCGNHVSTNAQAVYRDLFDSGLQVTIATRRVSLKRIRTLKRI